jgi:hypothetical protein
MSNLIVINTPKEPVTLPIAVLKWAVEHYVDFDFHYFQTVMEPEEMALYKQTVIEHTYEFFQSLMD